MEAELSTALTLLRQNAPPAATVLATLAALNAPVAPPQRAAAALLGVLDELATKTRAGDRVLPEFIDTLRLDDGLPPALRLATLYKPTGALPPLLAEPTVPASARRVVRNFSATTPRLQSALPFAEAAARADVPRQWGQATWQIELASDPVPLPRNGALWRARIDKRTSLLKPVSSNLVTRETIEVTADGADHDGAGYRRYVHSLVRADREPDHPWLLDDRGWIELCGDASGTQMRIHKDLVVSLPEDLDRRFGALLQFGLDGLLWAWAAGFLVGTSSGTPGDAGNVNPVKLPPEIKLVRPGAGRPHVAVLGAGPAGLACAWLLGNPQGADGPAWHHPDDPEFKVQVTLVEQECQPGGKAASVRNLTDGGRRIEEHGLHVLMGCYRNLLGIVHALGACGALSAADTTRIALGNGADPAQALQLQLGSWRAQANPQTLAKWLSEDGLIGDINWRRFDLPDITSEWLERALDPMWLDNQSSYFRAFVHQAQTRHVARPMLRTVLSQWQRLRRLAPNVDGAESTPALARVAMQGLLQRLVLADITLAAGLQEQPAQGDPQPRLPGPVAPLAELLRGLARVALPADDPDPAVRLAGELLELACTVMIGLESADLFPAWTLDHPDHLLQQGYAEWTRGLQDRLDGQTFACWLDQHGSPGFGHRSRVVVALASALFTTAEEIAAGTFVHGLARLLLTYEAHPYHRMKGGTGEAVIGPLFQALQAQGATLRLGTRVEALQLAQDGDQSYVQAATVRPVSQVDAADFGHWNPSVPPDLPGWRHPMSCQPLQAHAEPLAADAFVLAMPPFGGTVAGLPEPLNTTLGQVQHCATLGLQHWTTADPLFPGAIQAGLADPLQCVAAMDHLAGGEGAGYEHAPAYYCGHVDDGLAAAWHADNNLATTWLQQHATNFQPGDQAHRPYVRVNLVGSQRYGLAGPASQAARSQLERPGVQNLWLAGDWTRTAFNCGAIEAAVTSGLEAAASVLRTLGCEVRYPIIGSINPQEPA